VWSDAGGCGGYQGAGGGDAGVGVMYSPCNLCSTPLSTSSAHPPLVCSKESSSSGSIVSRSDFGLWCRRRAPRGDRAMRRACRGRSVGRA
jgi:hypothetical protein